MSLTMGLENECPFTSNPHCLSPSAHFLDTQGTNAYLALPSTNRSGDPKSQSIDLETASLLKRLRGCTSERSEQSECSLIQCSLRARQVLAGASHFRDLQCDSKRGPMGRYPKCSSRKGHNLDVINQARRTINDGIQFPGELRIH